MPDEKEGAVEKYEERQLMPVSAMVHQFSMLQELMEKILKKDVDYGVIPGMAGGKPTLLKPGAEKICTMFRLDPQFVVLNAILEEDFVMYDVRCDMYSIHTGNRLGSGTGSANSREEKWMWRKAIATKEYDDAPPDKRRVKLRRKSDGSTWEEKQVRQNPYDLANTIEKMACKRALVAATLVTTAASSIWTQDIEELPPETRGQASTEEGTDARKPSDGMVKLIHVLLGKLGYKESDKKHDYCTGVLGRPADKPIASLDLEKDGKPNPEFDMTFDEAKSLIDKLQVQIQKKGTK